MMSLATIAKSEFEITGESSRSMIVAPQHGKMSCLR
jgi:hypothetical protein